MDTGRECMSYGMTWEFLMQKGKGWLIRRITS